MAHRGPYSTVLIRQCRHLSYALRKRILQRELTQTRVPDEVLIGERIQITVASYVHEMFESALSHLKALVDDRDQAEINNTFALMLELINLLEVDETPLDKKATGLVTEIGYLVQYFR